MPWKIALGVALVLAAALSAHAAPLVPADIPESAKWVMHLNVDGARGTPLWEVIRIRFILPRQDALCAQARGIENATGMVFPRDLHDVTLYGTGYDDASVCILLHAVFDQTRTIAFLKTNPQFQSINHNGHAIVGWLDRGRNRLMYGSFVGGQVAILAPNAKAVGLALDTLDGKSPGLKPNSPLAGFNSVGGAGAAARGIPIFWVAGVNVSELPRAQRVGSGPYLAQMDDARLGISLAGNQVNARLVVMAKSEQAAQQMVTSAEGIKANVSLSAADEHAGPTAKMAAAALQNLSLTADSRIITAELSLGINDLDALLEATRGTVPMAGARGAGPLPGGRGRGAGPRLAGRVAVAQGRPPKAGASTGTHKRGSFLERSQRPHVADGLSNFDDRELARRALAGSSACYEEIVRRYQVPLLRFLNKRFPSRRDAEDILQDTFLKVWQSLHMFDEQYEFRTWLYTIAYRLAVSRGRRLAVEQPLQEFDQRSDEPAPDAALAQEDEKKSLWKLAKELLTEEQYTALWLHYVDDVPAGDIAAILNRSWVSVKTLMHRARKKLLPYLTQKAGLAIVMESEGSAQDPEIKAGES